MLARSREVVMIGNLDKTEEMRLNIISKILNQLLLLFSTVFS